MSQSLIRIRLHGRSESAATTSDADKARIDLTAREAGQIIVIFALMLTFLIGMVGIAIDVTFAWRAGLQLQRGADAGALAGVVYLPGDLASAQTEAASVAAQNGYTSTNSTVTVNNNHDPHELDVNITTSVPTFFVRIFGINNWTVTRSARAGFQLPVPMGSPENFYGVYCLTTPSNKNCAANQAVPGANSTTVYSHGSWGANMATGTDHGQGDAFIPLNDRSHSLGTNSYGGTNPNMDPTGYNYAVELPAGGTIYIFDPTACAVGDQVGTGDHYNDAGGWEAPQGSKVYSVSTYFKVYDMTSSPLNYANQDKKYDSKTLFENEYQYDKSGTYGTPSYVANLKATSADGIALKDCGSTANPAPLNTEGRYYHNKWWPMFTTPTPGTYRINISSAALAAANAKATFENDWSIEAVGGVGPGGQTPRVYGLGKIVAYNIIQGAGTQSFYLAQIGPENAGKTLEIDLFDIGDISGTGSLTVLSPDGNAYNAAKITYSSDANCGTLKGSSDFCARAAPGSTAAITVTDSSGHQSWQDSWMSIQIKLLSGYGCSILAPCLKPPGETQQGWWKIQYSTSAGANDTTTWMTSLVGNPVHLVPMG